MKVELRKVKVHKDMSEETTCYSAEVFLDGVKAGDVRNDGRGGCDMLSPPRLTEVLGAYAKTMPTRVYCGRDDYRPTWETVLADALDVAIARREFDRAIGKRVLFVDEKGKVRLTKTMTGEQLANAVSYWTGEGKKVLNAMPREEAFARYYAATCPDENRPEALAAVTAMAGA